MSVPANMMFNGLPPIDRNLPPEVQAKLLKARLQIQGILPPDAPAAPAPQAAPAQPGVSSGVLDMLMGKQPTPTTGQVLNQVAPGSQTIDPNARPAPPTSPSPIGSALVGNNQPNPFVEQGPPESEDRTPPTNEGQPVQ